MSTAINHILFLFKWIRFPILLLVGLWLTAATAEAQNITRVTGGEQISADEVNGAFTALTDLVIDETSEGQISRGILTFKLPEGFEWDPNAAPTIAIEAATGYSGQGTGMEIEFTGASGRDLMFNVLESSDTPPNKAGRVTFSGLFVRPTSAEVPSGGEITATGAAVPNVNDTYGYIGLVAGIPDELFIETAPDGSGVPVADQEITAGNSITAYAIARDQGGNFIENVAADRWDYNGTGLSASPLTVANDRRSATFSSTITGTATLSTAYGSLTPHPTGVLTVVPGTPSKLSLQAAPSVNNTAGVAFATQPVLAVQDAFGNTITSDDFTSVTASRSAGSGTLYGTVSQNASEGKVSFTDLFHTVANDITIHFSASGLTGTTTDLLTISPTSADSLTFITQPTNGSRNTALSPPPQVQLLDIYGNKVPESGVEVSLVKASDGGALNGTSTVSTDADGVATFTDIKLNQEGQYSLRATSSGLKDSEPSQNFTIANAGSLAGFEITQTDGSPLISQTAGEPFSIRIAAVDGAGELLDGNQGRDTFNGSVDITTSSVFSENTDTIQVGPFVDGVIASHRVELLKSAEEVTLTATHEGGSESGGSQPFTLHPNTAFPDSTILLTGKNELTANGSDTTKITIQLKDVWGNRLISGGDEVVITQNGTGTLSPVPGTPVTDHENGTYSALLTAPTDVGAATLDIEINGTTTELSETISFIPGPLATFRLEDAGTGSGMISDQTAGKSFAIRLSARDAHQNLITSYSGKVEISSEGTITSGVGTSAAFENGVLSSHSIIMTSAGEYSLKVRNAGYSETGESNLFTVSPGTAVDLNSSLTADAAYLENSTSNSTTIRAELKDTFGNSLTSEDGNTVTLAFASAANATLSSDGNTGYEGNGIFSGSLTASSTIETVNVTGSLNGGVPFDTVQVVITQLNEWVSATSGSRTTSRDWGTPSNWNLDLPTTGQVVQVPNTTDFYPVINQNTAIDFLNIEDDATVNLEPGYVMDLYHDMSGAGTFICDRSTVNIGGDLTVATYASSTCHTVFNGEDAIITGRALTGTITIDTDLTLTGSLQSLDSLIVTEGNTLTVEEGANLDIQGGTKIDGELVFNGGHLSIGNDVDGSSINTTNTTVEFNGSTAQDINGMDDFNDLIINNPEGVTFHNDVVVDGTLVLEEGTITIDSGYSLVTDDQSGNLENIRMLRDISGEPGWRMISSPLASTYKDLLDSTLTQGYTNSELGTEHNGQALQPNVLYFQTNYDGTDNQRWRAPGDGEDQLTPGRGLFVYFFGDIPEDDRYNNPLPDDLSVTGAENMGTENAFQFEVDYPTEIDPEQTDIPEADLGFNMVGNPFAATIDWSDGNWIKEYMDNVIYVWDPAQGDYLTWNGIDGSLGNGLIMPFQAFWVRATGGGQPKLSVSTSSKTTGGTYKGKKKEPASIEFLLEADRLRKETHITLSEDGKTGKDQRDAYRMLPFKNNSYLELYTTLENGSQLAINNLSREFGKKISIPFHVGGYKEGASLGGEYTLSWPAFGNVPDAWTMVLEDRQTGEKMNLRKNTFYTFTLHPSKQKAVVLPERPRNQLTADIRGKAKRSGNGPRFMLHINPGADGQGLPKEYSLDLSYPNPFRESTTIQFATPLEGRVQLYIYDILGRKVKTLVNEDMPPDFHELEWAPRQLASGVYICVMRAGGKQFIRKMTYIK